MGIVMIPDMSSNQLTITVNVPDDTAKEDAFATADSVMDAVMTVDGVDTVGAMSGGSSDMVAMAGGNAAATTPRLPITSCWATSTQGQGRGAGDLRQNSRSKLRN